ncbi:MAG: hypothetical protein ABI921_15255, partial [Panacibacter sp.]
MNLKIFVPDIQHKIERKICVLPLIPFVTNDLSQEQRIERFGGWINRIQFVDAVEDCDIVMPAHYVNYYASRKKLKVLAQMNNAASHAGKPTVCWTNGDWGVTPKLNHFHLYRLSGYHSSNEGNQFCYPFFLGNDPLHKYYRGILPVHKQKPEKPLIGFCGRASKDMLSTGMDIAKNLGRAALKIAGRWPEDTEQFYGSSSRRYTMLKALQKSPLVETNFILHKAFKGGERNAEDRKRLSELFYTNMKQSHYIFCYRGWGNYSIRLY